MAVITKTDELIGGLQFSHHWLLKKVPHLTQDYWTQLMFDYGVAFAEQFSNNYLQFKEQVKNALLLTPAEAKQTNNWYWSWFKLKWLQDDKVYVDNHIYKQPISYLHYKTYMLNCEVLEQDLLFLISKKQFKND